MSTQDDAPSRTRSEPGWLLIALLLWFAGVLRQVDLPGLYMDAINPEYLVAHALHPALSNPRWLLPARGLPILGNLYHGVQDFYFGVPFFALFGTTLTAVRLFHGLFGAALLLLVHRILRRLAVPAWLAGLAAIGLATDTALLAALRTQYAIILGGTIWALLAILLALRWRDAPDRLRWIFLSGICFGLSIYGYFVLGFLGPAMLWMLWALCRGRPGARGAAGAWVGGAAVGMLPYVAGYLSWWAAVGGFHAFLESVGNALQGLQVYQSAGLAERLSLVGRWASVAWTNEGAELLMLGERVSRPYLSAGRLWLLAGVTLGGIVCAWRRPRGTGELTRVCLAPLMVLSYCASATLFVPRLWAHHFGAVLPLLYLGAGAAAAALVPQGGEAGPRWNRLRTAAVATALLALLAANVAQQRRFFRRLAECGGRGYWSDATTSLAERALHDPAKPLYVFPEWGFFMPFAFLTANRVPYALELDAPPVRQALAEGREVIVATWKPEERPRLTAALSGLGATRQAEEVVYQRDGAPAFYLIRGLVPAPAP
jgi:hypothetical protein